MSRDIHSAQCAAADAGKYLAMAWMAEMKGHDLEISPGEPIWPLKLAMDRLTEAANALGYTLTPVAAPVETPAPCAEYNEENADAA